MTYSSTTSSTTTTAASATATTTSGGSLAVTTFGTRSGTLGVARLIRLAGKLNGDLALQDVLAGEFLNGLLRLLRSL